MNRREAIAALMALPAVTCGVEAVTESDNPNYPFGEFDASKWAAEFVRRFGGDEGLMLSWFASAIMTGYDHHARKVELG